MIHLLILILLINPVVSFTYFGMIGSPKMYYDYQRDTIILYGGINQQVLSLNPQSLNLTTLGGTYQVNGYRDGTNSLFDYARDMVPFYDKTFLKGYYGNLLHIVLSELILHYI